MALVTERLNINKPATPEPKAGAKLTASQLNNNKVCALLTHHPTLRVPYNLTFSILAPYFRS